MNLWGINTDAKVYVKNIQNVSMIFYRLVCGIMYTCLKIFRCSHVVALNVRSAHSLVYIYMLNLWGGGGWLRLT